jgi:polysaccharide pyruvyl transferase WcaK-like protein
MRHQEGAVVTPRLVVVADVDGPGHYHLGDEAMLEANLRMFRQLVPHIQFTVPSNDPTWTSTRYGVESLPRPYLRPGHGGMSQLPPAQGADSAGLSRMCAAWLGDEIAQRVRDADGLVVSGGGNLCETWPGLIWERVALIEVARAADRPAVVLGQTLGPALSADQRQLLAASLPSCAWVGVRDELSADLALSLGVPPDRLHQQLDDAFFLEPEPVTDDRVAALSRTRKPTILVTLDASFGGLARAHTLDLIASQLDALVESLQGTLVFAPHVGGADVPDALADAAAARALRARLHTPVLVLDTWQPREMRWLVGEAALVVSTRYHPLVFATASGTAALGIYTDAYTRTKLRGALTPAGLQGWCISVADVERHALLPLAMELWHRRQAIQQRLVRVYSDAASQERHRWVGICRALHLEPEALPVEAHPRAPTASLTQDAVKKGGDAVPDLLANDRWWQFEQQGYLRLGSVLDASQLAALQQRMDDIMLGRIRNPALQFQLDTGGRYEDLPDAVAAPTTVTLAYRKVQGLESDPLVLGLIRRDVFREICARQYGKHASVSIFRAMMMNKPASQGTHLPWHQDAGDVWKLDRDPLVTIWIALDPAKKVSGCLEVIAGSHRLGLLSRNGSTISADHAEIYCPDEAVTCLEIEAGEALLLHNWLLHRSGVNRTDAPRRALTTCYMDGRTTSTLTGDRFPIVFGEHEDTDEALPFLKALRDENQRLRATAVEAERYTKSLLEDNQRREQMRSEAEAYAISLEGELARLRAQAASSTGGV